ncbi:DHA2 family efflux MFS transporter permease subunit [Hyphomicrobium sp.]|uniref:DHA2 family efflux MFS transporter permease subunit n=1 Tax=Hyphomicrobium sp. TaxID=82 RepID=UPI002D776236|nr:DHA2 family efflux MFS transporter permease subunit [Hyphomicrobium sp.]HET6389844.1 DHA2 family efflux MFS transporter permease subunit [Hyphomicrobium sp.]
MAIAAGNADAAATPMAGSSRAIVTICVMTAALMEALDSTIANVALPYMRGSLATTSYQIEWVLTSYIVAAAIMTPATGWLDARFGRRPVFLVCVFGFLTFSMLCGTATNITQIVLYRLMQGMFGAPLVPLSQAILLDIYPRSQRGQAMAIFGVGVMLGPILGPLLGGYLTQYYDWRWVFYVNVPFGIFAFVLGWFFVSEADEVASEKLDWFGFGVLAMAIGALQLFLDRGQQLNWFQSTEIKIEFALFLLGVYLFIVHTLTARRPFLDSRLFADRNFVVGQILIFLVGAILFATLSLMSPYLENLMNYPVFTAGLVLAPRGLGTMVAMWMVGQLISRVDVKWLLLSGLALTAYSLYEMSKFTQDISQFTIIWTGVVQGFGLGFVFVPLSTVTFVTLPSSLTAQATGCFNLMRNVGSSVGISVTTFLLTRNSDIMHSALANHISPYSRAVQSLDPATIDIATEKGKAIVNEMVTAQAQNIAYEDNYRLMMYLTLLTMPLVFLLRNTKPIKPGAPRPG